MEEIQSDQMAGVGSDLRVCWEKAAAMPFYISQPLKNIFCIIASFLDIY